MVKLSDVVKLADSQGFVSVARLQEAYQLAPDKACRALLLACDRGLLMPVAEAFFARPINGLPISMREKVSPSKRAWYKEELALLEEHFNTVDDGDTEAIATANTVNEIRDIFEIDPEDRAKLNRVRAALKVLVSEGRIKAVPASAGGAFGHRPIIYGNDDDAIKAKDKLIGVMAEKRKKERAANKG